MKAFEHVRVVDRSVAGARSSDTAAGIGTTGSGPVVTDTGGPLLTVVTTDGGDDAQPGKARRHRTTRWPTMLLSAALVALALTWGGWILSGGGLFWVGSPSMGTVAPVGSLIATQPLAPASRLSVGQVVVFEAGSGRSATYIHRISEALPGGRYLTKGDLNQSPDPWVITRANVTGTPQAIIPAIGWIYKCTSWVFLGAAVLMAVALFVEERRRRWILALAPVVILGVPLLRYQPLIGGFVYGSGRKGRLASAAIVDTGILPVRFAPTLGRAVHAAPGQEVTVTGISTKHSSILDIRVTAALPWWGWALVVMVCLVPLVLIAWRVRHSRLPGPVAVPLLADAPGPVAEDAVPGTAEAPARPGGDEAVGTRRRRPAVAAPRGA